MTNPEEERIAEHQFQYDLASLQMANNVLPISIAFVGLALTLLVAAPLLPPYLSSQIDQVASVFLLGGFVMFVGGYVRNYILTSKFQKKYKLI